MSQTHSHGPGQPQHSHGPPQQPPPGAVPQQARPVMVPTADPVMQAIIEASFIPVDISLGAPENSSVLCEKHGLEKCSDCDVDFLSLNRLSKLLHMNPNIRCPPPPQMLSQKLSSAVNNTKDEGNAFYKAAQHDKAIQRYTMAANIAAQRPPWEASQVMREEVTTILSNRSASYLEADDPISALVDAEVVIQLKRPWGKGHFRKAKALEKMKWYEDSKAAIELGLTFEPDSKACPVIQMNKSFES
ncbi:hypothetical protein PHLCEN_2v6012 [Hermanssonia centrifuga]|uniref:Translocation protein sec72 n=1 Tax=Hermanssonia centrifuga TaxID=98765 RepID=A0A2R6P0K4_9APHY|nr:hypothetical protein PHLCEN_2v6012 [Hermanssonia centrifuga]